MTSWFRCDNERDEEVERTDGQKSWFHFRPGKKTSVVTGEKRQLESKILDLGCADKKFPGAIGVDLVHYPCVDVVQDVHEYLRSCDENRFKLVVMRHFIEHVDPQETLRLVHRVLEPGGKVWVETPNALYLFRVIQALMRKEFAPNAYHILVYGAPELRTVLRRNGFKNIEISYIPITNDMSRKKRTILHPFIRLFPMFSSALRATAEKE